MQSAGWSRRTWLVVILLSCVGMAGAAWFAKAANDAIMGALMNSGVGVHRQRRAGDGPSTMDVSSGAGEVVRGGGKAAGALGGLTVGSEGDMELLQEGDRKGEKATGCAMCVYVFPPLVSTSGLSRIRMMFFMSISSLQVGSTGLTCVHLYMH